MNEPSRRLLVLGLDVKSRLREFKQLAQTTSVSDKKLFAISRPFHLVNLASSSLIILLSKTPLAKIDIKVH